MTDLTKLVPFHPEDVTDNKWDQETVRVILVHPPIVRKLKEYGGVNEDKSRDDGEGSPEIFLGKGTHTKFLDDNLKLVAELISKRRLVTNTKAIWNINAQTGDSSATPRGRPRGKYRSNDRGKDSEKLPLVMRLGLRIKWVVSGQWYSILSLAATFPLSGA